MLLSALTARHEDADEAPSKPWAARLPEPAGAAVGAPLTSEPPLAEDVPLTSEPPLAAEPALTSEPTAVIPVGAVPGPMEI
nr:hypothetical protein [Streptomyces sp. SID5468]